MLAPSGSIECHEDGVPPPGARLLVMAGPVTEGGPVPMLHVGLDLSRTRVDVHAMDAMGNPLVVTTASPDAGGLGSLVNRLAGLGGRCVRRSSR
jgi:hypothetical protein